VTAIAPNAATAIRTAIALAGGREVCFACTLDSRGCITAARVVARGDARSVLALPGFARPGELLLHNHPSGILEASQADLEVAARLHDLGVGFGITDNDASSVYVVVEVPQPRPLVPIALAEVDRLLSPGGAIAQAHPGYEDRQGQRAYARAVAKLYNSGGIGLLEAGTGIGKSLGYLLPALYWSTLNGERTVVSTNTINLQEQLVGKDLPFLERALGEISVRFALLKGWRNYLCLARLEHARREGATLFDQGGMAELQALSEWAHHTRDGSLSDLAAPPSEEVWDEVSAEPDLCQRTRCRYFDSCFVFEARRRAARADVIVVNHHLLLSDLAVRRTTQNWEETAVLPPFSRLIVDEGHHLEDAAASHLGSSLSRQGLDRLFARLERKGRGLLAALLAKLRDADGSFAHFSRVLIEEQLLPSTRAAVYQANLVFDLLAGAMAAARQQVLRLGPDFLANPVWEMGLRQGLDDLVRELEFLGRGLAELAERLEQDPGLEAAYGATIAELTALGRRLQGVGDTLRGVLAGGSEGDALVRWIELRGRRGNVVVVAVPLDLAPILREDLFRRLDTCIVTSATLATDGRFDFLRTRLGLDQPDVEPACATFPSPFDYREQALLGIPTDVTAPNESGEPHVEAVAGVLADLATVTDGGVFALFTSHRDVRRCAELLRLRGLEGRWPLLVHGEDSRATLLRRFTRSGRGILLGTASFWEGVDVPGDPLRALLLARLPFRVPTEPLTAARCERIARQGGDPFRDYMLPDAALRLKQGFGRLIRSSTDRGAIVLTDPRILAKSYGSVLLDTLPPARRVVGSWCEVKEALERFFAQGTPKVGREPRRREVS
jgi:ATP-dependent DNA helicase DinG